MRINTLHRVIEIQNLVLAGKKKGFTQKHIYETMIYPKYFISYTSFNRYLSYPAKQELRLSQIEEGK